VVAGFEGRERKKALFELSRKAPGVQVAPPRVLTRGYVCEQLGKHKLRGGVKRERIEPMAKRRRRGLGSSAAEHTRRLTDFLHTAAVHARGATRAAKGGKCGEALMQLSFAQEHYGAAIAEHEGAGNRGVPAHANVRAAREAFRQHCLIR
jgi:hypothetical protein